MLNEVFCHNRRYFVCNEIKDLGIKNCFTTKCGGVSSGKIEGLNLGFRVSDNKDNVIENYKLVASDFGFTYENIVSSKQEHTKNIRIITKEDKGKGISAPSDIEETDGLVTGDKDIPLVVFSADCYPLLFADKEKKAVAAVHSGWKGTYLNISGETVKIMTENFGCKAENIIVAVGAGIGPCCFETKWDVASLFDEKYVSSKGEEKYLVDLSCMLKDSLCIAGIKEENIHFAERCTVCESDVFYSYRSQKERTGRMGAFISL